MNWLADENKKPKFVPFMLLSIALWSAGGVLMALWMMPDFDHGSRFTPFEEFQFLKSFTGIVGRQIAYLLITVAVCAGAGVIVGWRIYRALIAANTR